MESEITILKFILSNQGSVDTEELVYNLCDYALLSDLLCKNEKFVSCVWSERPLVVVRSRVTVCRVRDCPGCGNLHLCLGFLFSGSCPFVHLRRGCSFSHDLDSEYNMEVLREFGLETLSRTELCLLLLQSNNTLLPPICHNYNSSGGCEGECTRLHICKRSMSCRCNCPRAHDFYAPQPLKLLQDKHIPDHLIKELKSVYKNKLALRQAEREKATSETDPADCNQENAGNDSDSSCSSRQSDRGKTGRGGRGRRGQRGAYRGKKRNDRAPYRSESRDTTNIDPTEDYNVNDGNQDPKATVETLQDGYDTDSSSVSTGYGKDKRGGRGGFRGKGRGRGYKHAASVDGTNAFDGQRGGHFGNYRGNQRGGRGSRGNRAGNAERPHSKTGSQAEKNLDDIEAERSQSDEALGEADTGSAGDKNRNSSKKDGKPRASPTSNVSAKDGINDQRQRKQRDKTEICMFFIKGHCIHEDRCFKAHDKMPYRWEIKQGGQWTPMADNEKIEKDYCVPENTYSTTSPPVYFDNMKSNTDEVRRLSTVNSVLEPTFIHTTVWLWYWEDEYGRWYQYGAITSEHRLASITSQELEEKYLKNNKDVVKFTAGSELYELSFQDMIQTNLHSGTKRIVRRRPQFVSAADVQTKRKRPAHSTGVPDYWDKTLLPLVGSKKVTLQPTSGEYKEIQDLFFQTMTGFKILKIQRIQNKAVWEAFQLCKTHMKIKNGGKPVLEKKLFHGTDPKHVDTICEANFDWRVCGVNGTAFGQGSYFARDAEYSHDYTGSCDPRFMFVSRVLVGEFTKGSSKYRRPPSKDEGDVNLFDSCVNDVFNPTIFVIFKQQQIYPEYLLQYKQTGNFYTHQTNTATRPTTYQTYRQYTPQPTVPTRANPPVVPSYSTSYPSNTSTTTEEQSSCVIA